MAVASGQRNTRHGELKEMLLREIRNSGINTRLPSENELSRQFGVCRATVNKVMVELERERYIIRRRGKGTFVCSQKFEAIDSKTRSSFTRKYNNGVHPQASLWEEEDALTSRVTKRSKKRGSIQETKTKVKKEVEEEEESDTDSEAQYVY